MNSTSTPLYREVQKYSELPPFTLLAAVGALFGWFLIVWVVILGRPLGALDLPPAVALAIGLFFGVLVPLAYWRLQMVTEVYPDRVQVQTGPFGRLLFPLAEIADVSVRKDRIRDDYNQRQIGQVENTRIAYTVTSDEGIQLTLADERLILIGSKQPDELCAIVTMAWRAVRAGQALEADN
jgi:hypothetical protein